MHIIEAPSPNFKTGRQGRKIIAIVNHITDGLMPGTLNWLQNPIAKVSAHYLVSKRGQIYQLVKDEDTAYHAGIVNHPHWPLYDGTNPNYYTIGIEHEARRGEALTEAQYQATLWLHKEKTAQFKIPLDDDHIIGHDRLNSINRKNDPGANFPWKRLFIDLNSKIPTVLIKIGKQEIQGLLINNRTYAPLRITCESLGRLIYWDGYTNTVLIPPADIPIQYSPAIKIATGKLLIPALMQGDTSYAPLRKLAETLGHSLLWDGNSKIVYII